MKMLTRNGPAVAVKSPTSSASASECLERRCYPTPALTCALAGSFRIVHHGRQRTITMGAAVWIAAGETHEIFAVETTTLATIPVREAAAVCDGAIRVMRMSPLLREVVVRIASFADDEAAARGHHLEAVLADELDALAVSRIDARLPEHPDLRALCLAFLDDPSSTLSADEWAARFNLTRKTLARKFHSELHTTFGSWQRAVRVDEARTRLAAGQSVTQVAGDLGYDSLSAFAAMFRRTTGLTPSSIAAGEAVTSKRIEIAHHTSGDRLRD